jgi:3-hydroxyisobutyrate dehydrogenase-like beta-hydroxyacid dehydrogenase
MIRGEYWTRDEVSIKPSTISLYCDRGLTISVCLKPLGPVDVVIKDASHALALGEETGTKLYNTELGLKHLKEVKERQGAKGDMTGIYGVIRTHSGLPYENTPLGGQGPSS